MDQILVNITTRAETMSGSIVEIADTDGKVLGFFEPILQPPYNTGIVPPALPDSEYRQILNGPKRYTTEQVRQIFAWSE
jgi:hypothetical protein